MELISLWNRHAKTKLNPVNEVIINYAVLTTNEGIMVGWLWITAVELT